MNTIIFKTENAVFQFDRKDVKTRLEILATEYGVDEAEAILNRISISSIDTNVIPEEHDYFRHIVLELISADKGSVVCNVCKRSYKPNQLKTLKIGHGKSPFDVNHGTKGGVKDLFMKKRKLPLFGGQGLKCPAGHELISMITWRT